MIALIVYLKGKSASESFREEIKKDLQGNNSVLGAFLLNEVQTNAVRNAIEKRYLPMNLGGKVISIPLDSILHLEL